MTVVANIPVVGPIIEPITDAIGGVAERAGEAAFGFVLDSILAALANACRRVVEELITFLDRSAAVSFDTGWWASDRGQELFATVLQLSAVLMLLFLLLAVIQGVLADDPAQMVRAALIEAPLSMLGTVALVAVTTALLAATDGASSLVLAGAPDGLGRFASGFGTTGTLMTNGLLAVILAGLFLVGAVLVWIELAVRAALVYFLVLVGPLALSARVWPAARGMFRKLCELGVAIVVSKFAIALALALGAAALGGGGPDGAGAGAAEAAATDLSGLLAGATLMLVAAFTPFVVIRLVPVVEAAAVAHGVSRSPVRGAMATAQGVYYGHGLARVAGAGRSLGGGVPGVAGAGGHGPGSGSRPAPTPPPTSSAPGAATRPSPPVGAGSARR
jgi:hypothetical protein